ncbi:MAG TPA: AI-2E family transporter [Pyrinomonadaceae bacterium]|nr:AI-2E family transporter [Pyrinomonadaceae bacterium]
MTSRNKQIRWWLLLAITVVALYLCWLMLKPFVAVLGWAAVLVIVFYPVHKRLVQWSGRPAASALLSCVLVVVMILVPTILTTLAVLREMGGAMQNLQATIATLTSPDSPLSGTLVRWLGRYVNIEQIASEEYLVQQLKGMGGSVAGQTLGLLGGLIGTIVQMFFVVFTMYYLFRDGERIFEAVRELLPLKRQDAEAIMARTRDVIGASVYGVFVIAIIQGTLGGLAFWVLGLRSALVWGVAMTLLSMIPMVGAFLVWIPAAIFLAMSGHWLKAVLLVVWGTLVIGTVDNFLRPKLVGSRTKLHELFVFFAVLGGLKVFGVLGLVMGPVILAITISLIEVFRTAERSATT